MIIEYWQSILKHAVYTNENVLFELLLQVGPLCEHFDNCNYCVENLLYFVPIVYRNE